MNDFRMRPTPRHFTPTEINEIVDGANNLELWPGGPQLPAEISAEVLDRFLDCTARRSEREPTPEPMLRVGDEVAWCGGWGENAPRMAKVTHIEIDCNASAENGLVVREVPWFQVPTRATVVDLQCGSWAYGTQIYPDLEAAILRAARKGRLVGLGQSGQPADAVDVPRVDDPDGDELR